MKKSLLALLLVLAMALPVFSASAETLEMSDIPNMTAPGVLPIVTEPVTLTIALTPNSGVTDYKENDWTLWLEDQTGINLEFYFLPSENPGQKVELMIAAGEELPDIVNVNGISDADLYNYYMDGSIIALDDLVEKYAYYSKLEIENHFPNGAYDSIDRLTRTYDGSQIKWATTYMAAANAYPLSLVIWIRDDWLEKAGMEVPHTTDALYDALSYFRDNDMNGNGDATDEVPMISGVSAIINAFVYYYKYNGTYLNVDADGQIYMPQTTDAYREALTFLNKMVNDGLLSSLAFTADDAQLRVMANPESPETAIAGAFMGHPTSYLDSPDIRVQYSGVFPLAGPSGEAHCVYAPQLQKHVICVSGDCKTPEIAVRLLDYFSEEETMIRSRWGVPGVDWEYVDPADHLSIYDYLGYEAYYISYDGHNPYAQPTTNMIWKIDNMTRNSPDVYGGRAKTISDDPVVIAAGDKQNAVLSIIRDYKSPEVVETIIYTEEEANDIAEISTSLISYMEECETRFIMGELSVENDWDTFQATLESIGIDHYLEVVQTAYDRTMGS